MSTLASTSSLKSHIGARARVFGGCRSRTRAAVVSAKAPRERERERLRTSTTRTKAVTSFEGVMGTLASLAVLGQALEENTAMGRRASGVIITMGAACAMATFGALPASSAAYDAVWSILMPTGVVLALISTKIRGIRAEDVDVLTAFAVGAVGTVFGTVVSFFACGHMLGAFGWKIAASLCASYIGGSMNFAAVAQALDIAGTGGQGLLTAGMAVDNIAMCAYLSALMLMPAIGPADPCLDDSEGCEVEYQPTKASVACALATSLFVLRGSQIFATFVGQPNLSLGFACIFAPCVALAARGLSHLNRQVPENLCSVLSFAGAQSISGALMLIFFATLGANADLRSIAIAGAPMAAFITIQLATQLTFSLIVGHKLLKLPLWAVIISANANVGGPATAAAMAAARRWDRAINPAILVGTVGYAIATLIGVQVGRALASV